MLDDLCLLGPEGVIAVDLLQDAKSRVASRMAEAIFKRSISPFLSIPRVLRQLIHRTRFPQATPALAAE